MAIYDVELTAGMTLVAAGTHSEPIGAHVRGP
jgi:hypothetical protein